MPDSIVFPLKKEFSVNVEDMCFKLIIDRINYVDTESNPLSDTFHMHSHVEMFICKTGRISINTPKGIYVLRGGDLAVIPPNYPHTRLTKDGDEISEWCAINFLCLKKQLKDTKEIFKSFEALTSENKVNILCNKQEFCNEIYDVFNTSSEYNSIQPALRVVTAINGILGDFIKMTNNLSLQNKGTVSSDIDIGLLYKLDHIINTYFTNELTNAQIAEMLFISERQLSRIASKYYGTSIHHAIIDRRLVAAEKLLYDSDMTVESIGAYVGYNSKSGFYRDFRKKYGVTPIEYRSKYVKNSLS